MKNDSITPPTEPPDRRAGLSPPQFGLRSLMLFVAAICVSLALMKVVGPYGSFVLILFLLSVLAHVAGNAIGTKLRDQGSRTISGDGREGTSATGGSRQLTAVDFAPVTRLSRRSSLGVTIVVVVCVGVVTGASVGAYLLYTTLGEKATVANMALGVTAFGVIGGFVGFAASTFLKVLVAANLEAWWNGEGR